MAKCLTKENFSEVGEIVMYSFSLTNNVADKNEKADGGYHILNEEENKLV